MSMTGRVAGPALPEASGERENILADTGLHNCIIACLAVKDPEASWGSWHMRLAKDRKVAQEIPRRTGTTLGNLQQHLSL